MPSPTISPPSYRLLLPPLLASLPAAAISPQPPTALLPSLTPILRQRVQLLSITKDPWLPLLCYDQDKASKLLQVAKSDKFEPHPVSGEVEVDWDGEVETRYRRIDEETLETYIWLLEFDLSVKLLWCVGDQEGGGDGWRIGEVGVQENSPTTDNAQRGWETIGEAEMHYKETTVRDATSRNADSDHPGYTVNGQNGDRHNNIIKPEEDEDDDDATYWAQYDSTPARTPAPKDSLAHEPSHNGTRTNHNDEDAYYAQYSTVQPAMDNHDPDEVSQNGTMETTLDRSTITQSLHSAPPSSSLNDLSSTYLIWQSPSSPPSEPKEAQEQQQQPQPSHHHPSLVQPRPTSSSSSSSSAAIARLENEASSLSLGSREIGVKQHISTSVKSLFRLARAAGMERAEFERLVRTELEVLGLMDEGD